MNEQERDKILYDLTCRAEDLAIGLRELAADLSTQADNFCGFGNTEQQLSYCTQLQNLIYDIALRAKLVEQATKVFMGISTLRRRAWQNPSTQKKDEQ